MVASKQIVSSDVEKDGGSVLEIPYAQRDWHHSHRWTRTFLQWGLETRGASHFCIRRYSDGLMAFTKALLRSPRGTVSIPSTAKYFSYGCLPTSISYRTLLLRSAAKREFNLQFQLLCGHPGTSDIWSRTSRLVSSNPFLQPPL